MDSTKEYLVTYSIFNNPLYDQSSLNFTQKNVSIIPIMSFVFINIKYIWLLRFVLIVLKIINKIFIFYNYYMLYIYLWFPLWILITFNMDKQDIHALGLIVEEKDVVNFED